MSPSLVHGRWRRRDRDRRRIYSVPEMLSLTLSHCASRVCSAMTADGVLAHLATHCFPFSLASLLVLSAQVRESPIPASRAQEVPASGHDPASPQSAAGTGQRY